MVSFLAHMAVGILIAELILRIRTQDPIERSEDRVRYWIVGLFAGLLPDLDVVPALLTGQHPYTFHHTFTHTFLAMGIVAVCCLILFRKNKYALPFFGGYGMHLVVEFIDNSIAPLGPFYPNIEWGLLSGWGPMPGTWASEFWLLPQYENHYLWSIFLHNGWGIPFGSEFLSYYDLALIGVFAACLVIMVWLIIKKRRNK